MPGVFLSYRRDDTRWAALLLAESLRRRLGDDRVFHDMGGITAGTDFTAHIEAAVASCDVLMALIGSAWTTATDEAGRRRLDDPDDLVAREIASGLRARKTVVPVLVDTPVMPSPATLPATLHALPGLHAEHLHYRSWQTDLDRLGRFVENAMPARPAAARPMTRADAVATGSPRILQQWESSQQPPARRSPRNTPRPPPPDRAST